MAVWNIEDSLHEFLAFLEHNSSDFFYLIMPSACQQII